MKVANLHEQLIDEADILFCWLSAEAEIAFLEGDHARARRLSALSDRALFRLLRRLSINYQKRTGR